MQESLKNLVLTELNSAFSYYERVSHALVEIAKQHGTPRAKDLYEEFYHSYLDYIATYLLRPGMKVVLQDRESVADLRLKIKDLKNLTSSLLLVDFNEEISLKVSIGVINTIYQYSYELHLYLSNHSKLEIEYPRTILARVMHSETLSDKVERYFIASESLEEIRNSKIPTLFALDSQRTKRYEETIAKGHSQVFEKKFTEALATFEKALNYKESAEAINLVGWAHSLLGDTQKAKAFAIKAIEKDPHYGPPYNDLGLYLLNEGHLTDSIKWFELAKQATNYPNREYPYINAGRAHLTMNNYEQALQEFSFALTLNPQNEDLHKTIRRLKGSLKPRIRPVEGENWPTL